MRVFFLAQQRKRKVIMLVTLFSFCPTNPSVDMVYMGKCLLEEYVNGKGLIQRSINGSKVSSETHLHKEISWNFLSQDRE